MDKKSYTLLYMVEECIARSLITLGLAASIPLIPCIIHTFRCWFLGTNHFIPFLATHPADAPQPLSQSRPPMVLEVCVENVQSALNACSGGARRLELCSSLCLGGLTPSLGMFKTIRKSVPEDCQIFVMIRCKQGESYTYSSEEVEVMAEDIKIFKQNGADGFVFGCLTENKEIDERACRMLLESTEGLPSTFHRAFDVVKDPEKSLETISRLGFSRILTSGQEKTAFLGRHLIRKLVLKARELGSMTVIVAGGGVTPFNLKEILETTAVKEYHGSARANSVSPNEGIYLTDESVVREMIKLGQNVTS